MLSYEAKPVNMQFVDPFIWGRDNINIDIKFPTNPRIPTMLNRTPGTINSKKSLTSSSSTLFSSFPNMLLLMLGFSVRLSMTICSSIMNWCQSFVASMILQLFLVEEMQPTGIAVSNLLLLCTLFLSFGDHSSFKMESADNFFLFFFVGVFPCERPFGNGLTVCKIENEEFS